MRTTRRMGSSTRLEGGLVHQDNPIEPSWVANSNVVALKIIPARVIPSTRQGSLHVHGRKLASLRQDIITEGGILHPCSEAARISAAEGPHSSHRTFSTAGGVDGENIFASSINEEIPCNPRGSHAIIEDREKGGHSSGGQHIRARAYYKGAKQSPQ